MRPWSMHVTAADAAEFAGALGCPQAPGPGDPAPLTFLTRASWTDQDTTSRPESLGFDPARTLHAGERYRYQRPVLVGDVLTVEAAVSERFTRPGRRGGNLSFAVIRRWFREPSGVLVAEQFMTLAEVTRAPAATAGPGPDAVTASGAGSSAAAPAPPLPAAAALDSAVITTDGIARYAHASGDLNLIHRDAPAARAAGYPTVFAMGMFPAGLLASYAARLVGLPVVQAFDVRFAAQVWPGDVLEFQAGPREEISASADRLPLRCTTQRGETIMTGAVDIGKEQR